MEQTENEFGTPYKEPEVNEHSSVPVNRGSGLRQGANINDHGLYGLHGLFFEHELNELNE